MKKIKIMDEYQQQANNFCDITNTIITAQLSNTKKPEWETDSKNKNKEYSKSLYIERLNFLDIIGSCLFLDANNPVIKSVNIRKTNVCAGGLS